MPPKNGHKFRAKPGEEVFVRREHNRNIKEADKYRVINKSHAIRSGKHVAKQYKVLLNHNERAKIFATNEKTEKFINKRIEELKPKKRRNEKVQWSVVMRYKSLRERFDMNMTSPFSDDKFKLSQLTSIRTQGSNSDFDEFNWTVGHNTTSFQRSFFITFRYVDTKAGNMELNNCLLEAIQDSCPLKDEDLQKYRTIVKEGEMAKLTDIPEIEKALNININVMGAYESEMKAELFTTVNVTIFDNHFETAPSESNKLQVTFVKDYAFRKIVLYYYKNNVRVVGRMTTDGFVMYESTKRDFEQLRRLHHRVKHIWLYEVYSEPNEAKWKEFSDFDLLLKKEFKTSFTLYNSLAEFAVALFQSTLKYDLPCTNITQDAMFDCIMHAGGALVDKVEGEYDDCVSYDFNSFYPSLLMTNISIEPPVWGEPSNSIIRMLNAEEKAKYGVDHFLNWRNGWYHIEIEEYELKKETPRRFMKSKSGYYYCDELRDMMTFGYKFKLTDKRSIIFEKGSKYGAPFVQFYDTLYDFKVKTNNSVCKDTMNTLLGKLASKAYKSKKTVGQDFQINLAKNDDVVGSNQKEIIVKKYNQSKYRYMPWIQALVYKNGRRKLNELMDTIGRKYCVCASTDGVITTGGKVPNNIDHCMGRLKICKTGSVKIVKNKPNEWTLVDKKADMNES